jgi:hypothetical protein
LRCNVADMLAEERARLMQLAGEMATIAHHIESHRGDVNLFRCGVLKSLCKKCHDGLTESGKPKPVIGMVIPSKIRLRRGRRFRQATRTKRTYFGRCILWLACIIQRGGKEMTVPYASADSARSGARGRSTSKLTVASRPTTRPRWRARAPMRWSPAQRCSKTARRILSCKYRGHPPSGALVRGEAA